MECNNNLLNTTTMKTNEMGGGAYYSPKAVEITISPEGLLCSSFENLKNEFNYTWEEE